MAKYKVKGTDILHNKVIYAEGTTIELDDNHSKQLADYLELIQKTENEIQKKEEVKQTKPARVTKPKIVKEKEASVQPQKEPEVQIVSATNTPVVQATVTTAPITPEAKPQSSTQIPPAAQKVIANAITQVNKNLHNTQGKTNYQPSAPTNIRKD